MPPFLGPDPSPAVILKTSRFNKESAKIKEWTKLSAELSI